MQQTETPSHALAAGWSTQQTETPSDALAAGWSTQKIETPSHALAIVKGAPMWLKWGLIYVV